MTTARGSHRWTRRGTLVLAATALAGCASGTGGLSGPPPTHSGPAVTYVALGEQVPSTVTDPRLFWQLMFEKSALPYWATHLRRDRPRGLGERSRCGGGPGDRFQPDRSQRRCRPGGGAGGRRRGGLCRLARSATGRSRSCPRPDDPRGGPTARATAVGHSTDGSGSRRVRLGDRRRLQGGGGGARRRPRHPRALPVRLGRPSPARAC